MNRAAFALPLLLVTTFSLIACNDDDTENTAAPTFSQEQSSHSTSPDKTNPSTTDTSASATTEGSEPLEETEPPANPTNVLGSNPEAATAVQCKKDGPYERSLEKTFDSVKDRQWNGSETISTKIQHGVFEVGYCDENWVEFSADGTTFGGDRVAMTLLYPWSKTSEEIGSRYGNLPYDQVTIEGPLDHQICWKDKELRDAGVPDAALELLDICPAS